MKDKKQKVYKLLKKIPKGKISTYKAVSVATGIHPRAVGMILHVNPDPIGAPCYKIIKSDGSLGGYGGAGGVEKKIELLKRDGIEIRNGKVDLKKYLHEF
ncbi:MAG: MGMT family protein [Candidatus Aenigmarchaeota archaeon]|nr:MGMT family protein [Candidatus Aenigmarchaeota archaeon]